MGKDAAVIKREMMELGEWYHRIQLPGGLVTPGAEVAPAELKFSMIESSILGSLNGKTVLDLGCNAGGVSVEFAKRGARVTGVDTSSDHIRQARWVASVLELEIDYQVHGVYDVDTLGQFDIVVFFGLLYHLRHPMLALDVLRQTCREQLFLESVVVENSDPILLWAGETDEHRPADREGHYNWFLPSVAAAHKMLTAAGFLDVHTISCCQEKLSRAFISARVG